MYETSISCYTYELGMVQYRCQGACVTAVHLVRGSRFIKIFS